MGWFTKVDSKTRYSPDEQPPFWKLLLYALQQVIVMFPRRSPLHSLRISIFQQLFLPVALPHFVSFWLPRAKFRCTMVPVSHISRRSLVSWRQSTLLIFLDSKISIATFGIVMSGLVSIAAGFIVKKVGRDIIEKILPPTITGPIAMIIGLSLAGNAISDASMWNAEAEQLTISPGSFPWRPCSTILFSVYLKGFLSQLPLMLGMLFGSLVAGVIVWCGGESLFRALPETVANQGLFALPHFTIPTVYWPAAFAIMPVALATIPESTAHIYQLDVYVNELARRKGSTKKYDIANLLGDNLIGDGLGDIVAGFVGGSRRYQLW